jgi:hypothetical protein
MTRGLHNAPFIFICVASAGCLQTYLPPPIASPASNLVVEGFIDNGGDSTIFSLSRTFPLSATPIVTPELKAKVVVEGSDGSNFPLSELGNGQYGAPLSGLNPAATYRLSITTTAGKQYASDYVPLVNDPPIDSINWVRNDRGVTVYANTHDPTGNTRYFRWNYTETYEFDSKYETYYNVSGPYWVPMDPDTLYTCWRTDNSANIILASSTQLSQALIYEAPIVNYPVNSQQLSVEYSILVRQYALTKTAYAWWQIMQNITENTGSIFGVQPTANPGNLHCLTDTAEQVIGYVSAGNSWSQRIFITNQQVAPWSYFDNGCIISVFPQPLPANAAEGYWYLYQQSVPTPGFAYTQATCANCTLLGNNHPPSFWPQ